jgi:hypothetical protein
MTTFQQHTAAMERATEQNRPYSYICADGTRISLPVRKPVKP